MNTPMVEQKLQGSAKNSALSSLLAVIGQRRSWNLSMLPFVLWNAATNIRSYWKVRRLFELPAYAEAVRNNPRFPLKFLTHHYLVRGLSVSARAASFLHHYQRLHSWLPDSLLRQTLRADIGLVEIRGSGYGFSITMGLSEPNDKEGEYSLNFKVDGRVVSLISFNFVPGWVIGSTAEEVILITRVQGIKGCFQQIATATKLLHQVAPDQLLLAALQGIAAALNIATMAGVTGTRQTCYLEEFAGLFQKTYDNFFDEMGFSRADGDYYVGEIPLQQKPLSDIKRGHKIRTKEKRAFKQEIQSACRDYFLALRSATGRGSALEYRPVHLTLRDDLH